MKIRKSFISVSLLCLSLTIFVLDCSAKKQEYTPAKLLSLDVQFEQRSVNLTSLNVDTNRNYQGTRQNLNAIATNAPITSTFEYYFFKILLKDYVYTSFYLKPAWGKRPIFSSGDTVDISISKDEDTIWVKNQNGKKFKTKVTKKERS